MNVAEFIFVVETFHNARKMKFRGSRLSKVLLNLLQLAKETWNFATSNFVYFQKKRETVGLGKLSHTSNHIQYWLLKFEF